MKTLPRATTITILFVLLAGQLSCTVTTEPSGELRDAAVATPEEQALSSLPALIIVNTTDDELNNDGDCSLREAIQAANTNTSVDACIAASYDAILLPSGTYPLAISGSNEDNNHTGDLDILDDLSIEGSGAESTVIDGNHIDRVIHVMDTSLQINNITIANGGNASLTGGGIYNLNGSVTLNRCVIGENMAINGGGIENLGRNGTATMVLSSTMVISNTAAGSASGSGIGGGIDTLSADGRAYLTVNDSIIRGNISIGIEYASGFGAGIASLFDAGLSPTWGETVVTINNSSVISNSGASGGGICSCTDLVGDFIHTLTISNSVISGNRASGSRPFLGVGGGIGLANGTGTVFNSTISGNSAIGVGGISGLGGGVLNVGLSMPTTLSLINTTVTDNTAEGGGGGIATLSHGSSAVTVFQNTIIAGNSAPSDAGCRNTVGTLTSLGSNLEDGDTCNLDQPADQVSTDPLLGPLADNGGDTFTHALQPDSPAIDQGSCISILSDQRGFPRPVDSPNAPNADDGCDIGAYEYQIGH